VSYFVFGVACPLESINGRKGDDGVVSVLESCAAVSHMAVMVEWSGEPAILDEMRGECVGSGLRFMLAKSATDDTSDALVSPYVLGIDGAAKAARSIGEWVSCVVHDTKVQRVSIWFTEGFDIRFEVKPCRADQLVPFLETRISEVHDIPSMKLVVSG
jgi:hypothetical protein